MTHPLDTTNPLIVAAFRALIRSQGLIAFFLLLVAIAAYALGKRGATVAEPRARRIVRISFGFLWLLDGVLQAQPAMPIGLPGLVVQPVIDTSPTWVQNLANPALDVWYRHPLQAGTAVIWVQLAIGLLLLICDAGAWSRFAGVVAAGWGMLVWVLGEGFGGVFSPGASWLFGAPGAALFYVMAGLLIALPVSRWADGRLARAMLGTLGVLLVLAGAVQAWPGRGFWQGGAAGGRSAGGLSTMLQQMTQAAQPGVFANLVSDAGRFDARNGVLVNAIAAIAPFVLGVLFLTLAQRWRPVLARATFVAEILCCLVVWIFVQDLGFFGGVGTDPNSMPPVIILLIATYVANNRPPATVDQVPARGYARLLAAVASVAISGIALVGIVPAAIAATNRVADPILTRAVNGDPTQLNHPAPDFALTDQRGRTVSLATLRGKIVLLAFLDPVCNTDCPLIARQMRVAYGLLPAAARSQVILAAIATNPLHHSAAQIMTFDREQGVDTLPNWLFLNGPLPQLQTIWRAYGISVAPGLGTPMSVHSDIAYLIDARGFERVILGNNPGETVESASSLAGALTAQLTSIVDARTSSP